jgi:hypothetical protein
MTNLPSNNPNDIQAGYNANRKTVKTKAKAKGMLQAGEQVIFHKLYTKGIFHRHTISEIPYFCIIHPTMIGKVIVK